MKVRCYFILGYLLFGILCMMLFMTTIYEVPQFHVSRLFLLGNNEHLNDSSEKTRISNKVALFII